MMSAAAVRTFFPSERRTRAPAPRALPIELRQRRHRDPAPAARPTRAWMKLPVIARPAAPKLFGPRRSTASPPVRDGDSRFPPSAPKAATKQ